MQIEKTVVSVVMIAVAIGVGKVSVYLHPQYRTTITIRVGISGIARMMREAAVIRYGIIDMEDHGKLIVI